jgi:transcriptional regulator with XRE-family HTH domain
MQQTSTQRTAEAVRVAMARRQIGPGEIASVLGCSRTTLWRRLDGQAPFDVEQLALIAARLDVPLSTLVPEEVA